MGFSHYRTDAISRVGKNFVDNCGRVYRVVGVDFTLTRSFLFLFSRLEIGLNVEYASLLDNLAAEKLIPYREHRNDRLLSSRNPGNSQDLDRI